MAKFNYKKAVQILNFFAIKNGGKIDKMKACKLIFLADRAHLRKYARPIINDNYFALQYGPIPSKTKDIIEYKNNEASSYQYRDMFISKIENNNFTSFNDFDPCYFSDSDIEIMNKIYSDFGELSASRLLNITHKYPEWKKFEVALKEQKNKSIAMDYIDFFENPISNNDPIFDECEEHLELSKEIFLENIAFCHGLQ